MKKKDFQCTKCRCPKNCACCTPTYCYCTEAPLNTNGTFGI